MRLSVALSLPISEIEPSSVIPTLTQFPAYLPTLPRKEIVSCSLGNELMYYAHTLLIILNVNVTYFFHYVLLLLPLFSIIFYYVVTFFFSLSLSFPLFTYTLLRSLFVTFSIISCYCIDDKSKWQQLLIVIKIIEWVHN